MSRRYQKLTDEQRAQVVARYQTGERVALLAREYGVDGSTVRNHLHAAGVSTAPALSGCSVPGCPRYAERRGHCERCYQRAERRGEVGKPCSIPGCTSSATARGLCMRHYRRVLRHGTAADPPPRVSPPCLVPGCMDEGRRAGGYCQRHYNRWRKNGEPGVDHRRADWFGSPCAVPDCEEPACRLGLCNRHSVQHYYDLKHGRESRWAGIVREPRR